MPPEATTVSIVIPTLGRASLGRLLAALEPGAHAFRQVILIDDRADRAAPLPIPSGSALPLAVLEGAGRGPATARNRGWRFAEGEWVAFLDDDVVPSPGWALDLAADLRGLPGSVAASKGVVEVPQPARRKPTDWERNVSGLEGGAWITADMAFRRSALEAAVGFDERFGGAYREDTDIALRLLRGGWQIVPGRRVVVHPVPAAGFWVSVGRQRGNADDVLMRALHGSSWRTWGRAPRGRLGRHAAFSALVAAAGVTRVAGRRRLAGAAAASALGLWAELATARIAPGPRSAAEVAKMLATSAVLPLAATAAWLRGVLTLPAKLRSPGPPHRAQAPPRRDRPRAVLFDRDGTLVYDVPYNGDPAKVAPVPGAAAAIGRLRQAGIAVAVVSNQSGIGRGLLSEEQVETVNREIDAAVGPFAAWHFCPHTAADACDCRKPAPGLISRAASQLGVPPERCLMVGDIAADIQAAQAAGAAAILVPTEVTDAGDIEAAPRVTLTISSAIDDILNGAAA